MNWQEMNQSQKKLSIVYLALMAAFILPLVFFSALK